MLLDVAFLVELQAPSCPARAPSSRPGRDRRDRSACSRRRRWRARRQTRPARPAAALVSFFASGSVRVASTHAVVENARRRSSIAMAWKPYSMCRPISLSRKLRVHDVIQRARPPRPKPVGMPYEPTVSHTATHLMSFPLGGRGIDHVLDLGFRLCFSRSFLALPVVCPKLLDLTEIRDLGNAADRADHAGKRASSVGAAREAENVDLVAVSPLPRPWTSGAPSS